MDTILASLKQNVVDLYQKYDVGHRKIKQEVFDALKELSDRLPKMEVLYNDVHGGFDYSKHFRMYLDPETRHFLSSKAERIAHAGKIREYGKQCKSEFAFVAKLIRIYNRYHMDKVFQLINTMKYKKDIQDLHSKAYDIVHAIDDTRFGTETGISNVYVHNFKVEQVLKHDKQSILCFLTKQINDIKATIERSEHELLSLLTIEQYNHILEHHDMESEENIPLGPYEKLNERLIPGKGLRRLTFTDACERYKPEFFAVWHCQTHYNTKAMVYLSKHHELYEIESDVEYCSDAEIGLLCASGPYCKLVIGEAPQVLSWYVGEYDGLESIVIQP